MLRVMAKNALFGLGEMYKSLYVKAQVKELQKYIPDIEVADVCPGPAGVRAQAVDNDGTS